MALYSEKVMDHFRNPRNVGVLEDANGIGEVGNAKCGDIMKVYLKVEDGIISDAGFIGTGCAISQASASLMIDLIKGKSIDEARHYIELFFAMIKGEAKEEEVLDELEDAAALQGISHVPARVKCAVLSWHTLEEALDGKTGVSDHEASEDEDGGSYEEDGDGLTLG